MAERVDLYRFVESGSGLIWTLTNSDVEQSYDAGAGTEDYTPVPMGRGQIEQRREITKAYLDVTLDISHELCQRLLTVYGENTLFLTVFGKVGASVNVSWKGRLKDTRPADTSLVMNFESIFTSMRRAGLRARYQKSCRFALYARGCNLDPEDFATTGSCTALVGSTLTVSEAAGEADGYFTGGMVRAPDGSLSYIINHVGDQVTIQRVSYSIATEAVTAFPFAVTLYPGCDHSRSDCAAKFDNILNYGGFDWIPTKNPMGGSSMV